MRDEMDLYGDNATNYIATDVRELNTTSLTIEEQIQQVVDWAKEIIEE